METLLELDEITLADVVACQEDYIDEKALDLEISTIDDELRDIAERLTANKQVEADLKEARAECKADLISAMNNARSSISDSVAVEPYSDLFTTANNIFSGSEETEYFIARTYALAAKNYHSLPILIDSFRAEDLSSSREERALGLLGCLQRQVILTTTVKTEEGSSKYENMNDVNAIDYSDHEQNHVLSADYCGAFALKMAEFGICFTR